MLFHDRSQVTWWMRTAWLRRSAAARELASAFPEIDTVTYSPRLNLLVADSGSVSPVAFIAFRKGTRTAVQRDIVTRSQALLRARLGVPGLLVQQR